MSSSPSSAPSAVAGAAGNATSTKAPEFEPPQACVNRVVKSVLADNVQVTKDARAAITRAAGIFIFYLTHCANDFCKEHKRQTIYTSDVLEALKELDFGEFEPDVEEFIEQFRKESETKKTNQPRSKGVGDDEKGEDCDEDNMGGPDDDGGADEGFFEENGGGAGEAEMVPSESNADARDGDNGDEDREASAAYEASP